ncbi:MAG: alpha/beta hydrolase, partial [Chitinophagaceae bacterium]|nr:alpha/beta hydrolase [Rubrivivax sp.]
MQRTLVFNHANGFPSGTYRVLFDLWRAAGWRVIALPQIGHDPAYPVTAHWPRLREQLTRFIEAEAPGQRVQLVGHSLGGFLSLMAAARRPDLADRVVMIDSPVVAGWRAHSLQMLKVTGLYKRVSPSRVSSGRRWQWPSVEAAHAHFAAKAVFARWDPRVLRDYIACGTEPDLALRAAGQPEAVRLAFHRDIESRIYDTLPHRLTTYLRRHPPPGPVSFIAGTQSVELRQAGLAATRALTHGRIEWIEGSHLFPMEKPDETAAAVLRALDAKFEVA